MARGSRGFTLAELSVGLALAFLVLGMLMGMFISTQRSFQVVHAWLLLQQRAHQALGVFERSLWESAAAGEEGLPGDTYFAPGAVLAAADNVVRAPLGLGSDVLRLRLRGRGDARQRDCRDELLAAGQLRGLSLYTDESGTLRCAGADHSGGVPLVDGIDAMQLLFATAPNAAAPSQPLAYLPADQVPADAWNRVLAVRVALLVAGGILPAANAPSRRYRLLGTQSRRYGDGRLRRVFQQTFPMHDKLQRDAP